MSLCCWLNWPWTWAFVGLVFFPFLRRVARVRECVSGKTVFVTGGSEGIGHCMAEDFVRRGANVVLMARTESKLLTAVEELTKLETKEGQRIGHVCVDVTNLESVQAGIKAATEAYGTPAVCVAAAGTSVPGYFLEQDVSVFRRTMDLNYMGTVHVLKTVAPLMVENGGGRIMVVASAAACVSFIGYGSYSPTKFALRGLCDALRNELQGFGVKVSICYPPDTDTPGFKKEEEMKPVETRACFPADPYCPRVVGHKSVDSLLQGDYHIQSPDVLQNMLVASVAGVTPRVFTALEVVTQPILALIQIPFWLWFDYQSGKYAARTLAGKKDTAADKKAD